MSAETQQKIDALGAPYGLWIEAALADGTIRAPNPDYVGRLVFFHLDLVLDMSLHGPDDAMAFDMLCNSLGLYT